MTRPFISSVLFWVTCIVLISNTSGTYSIVRQTEDCPCTCRTSLSRTEGECDSSRVPRHCRVNPCRRRSGSIGWHCCSSRPRPAPPPFDLTPVGPQGGPATPPTNPPGGSATPPPRTECPCVCRPGSQGFASLDCRSPLTPLRCQVQTCIPRGSRIEGFSCCNPPRNIDTSCEARPRSRAGFGSQGNTFDDGDIILNNEEVTGVRLRTYRGVVGLIEFTTTRGTYSHGSGQTEQQYSLLPSVYISGVLWCPGRMSGEDVVGYIRMEFSNTVNIAAGSRPGSLSSCLEIRASRADRVVAVYGRRRGSVIHSLGFYFKDECL